MFSSCVPQPALPRLWGRHELRALYGSAPAEEILAGIIERKKRSNRMVELQRLVALNVHELRDSSF
jgi:hypothetical protein